MADQIDTIVTAIIAGMIGIALLCTAFIPMAVDWIGGLTNEAAQYQPLLYLVVIVVILSLVLGVIRFFTRDGSR